MKRVLILGSALFAMACGGPSRQSAATGGSSADTYRNPVWNRSMPDPTVIRADDGRFYCYATKNRVSVISSTDLVHWRDEGLAFTEEGKPSFVEGAGTWAPDINRIGGKYVMYYSRSVWGGQTTAGIGVAVSDTPKGPFTDLGKLFDSAGIGVKNSIDPFYIDDAGHKYLFWGSFNGIYGIELSADGLSLREGAQPVRVAGTAYEGTYIHKRDGRYYLFASTGSCCNGLKSTYRTVVGRSDALFGPYVNRAGEPMLENKHEVLIKGNDAFVGTGHNAELVTDDAGRDWILYHAFVVADGDKAPRKLLLDEVTWTDGWPVIAGAPSVSHAAPQFD